ncbi:MAG: hypothetical protein EZS28_006916 [Streblomastix strix]|uniref:Uncharacterized protein n=1 Tax=Streblomastix strix TaxID=222440 RepID=A0A5J4WRJ6_9EUKA|nr:MAG: hypothetical protein EZS28_006916 [Streblomastix strix]
MEVQLQDLSQITPRFAIPKAEQGKLRKSTDCSIAVNPRYRLHDQDRFRDGIPLHTSRPGISILSWIPSQQPLLQIQSDVFRCKTLSTGIQYDFETHIEAKTREQLQIRCISFCDDLLFLSQSNDELEVKKAQIFGMQEQQSSKLLEKKSMLEPWQTMKFLGWGIILKQIRSELKRIEDR